MTGTSAVSAAPLLSVKGVGKNFGGVRALDSVSFDIEVATVHGLIGPNGAGKSTMLNVIGGQAHCDDGDVRLAGRSIAGHSPARIASLGVRRTFQSATPLKGLSVAENVMAGAHLTNRLEPELRSWSGVHHLASEVLADFSLGEVADRPAGNLSFGHMRMLELARATVAKPQLLLLDEPAAGLAPADVRELRDRLSALRAHGIAILIVDHDVGFMVTLCDRLTVLNYGKVIGQGTPSEILASQAVREAYLGEWVAPDA